MMYLDLENSSFSKDTSGTGRERQALQSNMEALECSACFIKIPQLREEQGAAEICELEVQASLPPALLPQPET